MIVPLGKLSHETPAGGKTDPAMFDREGYAVGRRVLPPELLRTVRAPLIDALVADGQIERVEGDDDRFRWIGDGATFSRFRYISTIQDNVEQLLFASGVANRSVSALWGRKPSMWGEVGSKSGKCGGLHYMLPNGPDRVHRDGWMQMGIGGAEDHFNFWIPLTRIGLGDGLLALAVGSHRIPNQLGGVPPMARILHQDWAPGAGNTPPHEVLAPLWRTTEFELGDAVLFRGDVVHSPSANMGPYLRIALGLTGQDARRPLAPSAGLSLDSERPLTDIEWLTLAILTIQPASRWMARCAFYSRGIIGRLWTEQPDKFVERSFVTLTARGLIEPHETHGDPSLEGHQYHHATERGRSEVERWLVADPGSKAGNLLAIKMMFSGWLGLDTTALQVRERWQSVEK